MTKSIIKKLTVLTAAAVLCTTQVPMLVKADVQKRSEIDQKYKWKLTDLFASQEDWQKSFDKVDKEYIPKLSSYASKLDSPAKVAEFLNLQEEASRLFDKVYVYANFSSDLDTADSKATELLSQVGSLNGKFSGAVSFFEPELLAKSDKEFKEITSSPELKDYAHYFDSLLKRKEHTLSKSEEELLSKFSDLSSSPEDIYTKAKSADMVYPKIKDKDGKDLQLTDSTYSVLLSDPDRSMRKKAFEGVYTSFSKSKNTFAATLSAEVKKNIAFAQARKYKTALEAALAGDQVGSDVYENLVKSVNKNLDGLHNYVSLKKSILKLDKVHLYDMYVPLVDSSYSKKVSYEDCKKLVLEGLKPLGNEYISVLKGALDSNWADVYETPNKTTGAYNLGIYDAHPFVLLNYDYSIDGVLTTSHEFGHAMNSYYSNKTQKYVNANNPIFTAEVASQTNEFLMNDYLYKQAKTDDEKLYLLNQQIENIRGSVYTQVMYAEFEKAIHEKVENGGALSANALSTMWKDLMVKYYGDDFANDELGDLWWSRIPHFYMNFYVYKYATGMAASYALSQAVEGGKDNAVDKYINFLKAGSSDYPIEVLKNAGVDMLSSKPVDELLTKFNQLVDDMKKILKKQGKLK